eukprot:1159815-Pelagomonas_calceolata.AAC.2
MCAAQCVPQDVPDAKGDTRAGVRTLTVRLGADRVFWACIWIMTLAYTGAVVYSLTAATSIGAAAGEGRVFWSYEDSAAFKWRQGLAVLQGVSWGAPC